MALKKNATAPTELAKVDGSMILTLKVWLYLNPEQIPQVKPHLANFIDRRLKTSVNHDAKWIATPASESEIENATASMEAPPEVKRATGSSPDGEVFTSVVITLSTHRGIVDPAKRKLRTDMFDDVLKSVNLLFRHDFEEVTGIPAVAGKRIIAWSLRDPTSKWGTTFPKKELSRLDVWVLPAPKKPVAEKPAEKIEEVLYQLVNIKQKRPCNLCVKPSGGREALKKIQDLLYKQKTLHGRLHDAQKALEDAELGEDSIRKHVSDYIQVLEHIDQVLSSLVQLYEDNVGQKSGKSKRKSKSKDESSWFATLGLLFLRLFGKNARSYGLIKIDDENLEELKANARRELKQLQRVAPIIAAHARLRQSEAAKELKQVCDTAKAGPERSELPSKLSVQPANLLNKQAQVASLARVIKYYDASHEKVIEQVEALDKFVGKKFAEDGPSIFRDKRDRYWVEPDYKPNEDEKNQGPKKGKFRRLIAKLSKQERDKKVKVVKGVDSDGDSLSAKSSLKEDWCEKA